MDFAGKHLKRSTLFETVRSPTRSSMKSYLGEDNIISNRGQPIQPQSLLSLVLNIGQQVNGDLHGIVWQKKYQRIVTTPILLRNAP